jgi:hypothetical protein
MTAYVFATVPACLLDVGRSMPPSCTLTLINLVSVVTATDTFCLIAATTAGTKSETDPASFTYEGEVDEPPRQRPADVLASRL